jgi:hypothetical protein
LFRNSNFSNSILQFANLSNAFLVDANLSNADLTNSILNGAQLCGADLTGVTGFQKAKLNQVAFDAQTKLPAGGKEQLIANNGIYVGPKEQIKDCQITRTLE